MKKLLLVLTLALSVFYVNAQMNKVAAIAISANKGVTSEGFDDLSLNTMSELFMGQSFNISDELTRFKTYLFNDLAKEFPFEIIEESSIIGNEKFISFKNEYQETNIAKLTKRIPLEGYTSILGITKDQREQLSQIIETANAFMIVKLDYTIAAKTMIGGNGKAVGKAHAQIELFLPTGKRIMNLEASGMSDQGFGVVAGQITSNRDLIPQALKEASDQLFVEMKENLPKQIKKMNKKLAKLEE